MFHLDDIELDFEDDDNDFSLASVKSLPTNPPSLSSENRRECENRPVSSDKASKAPTPAGDTFGSAGDVVADEATGTLSFGIQCNPLLDTTGTDIFCDDIVSDAAVVGAKERDLRHPEALTSRSTPPIHALRPMSNRLPTQSDNIPPPQRTALEFKTPSRKGFESPEDRRPTPHLKLTSQSDNIPPPQRIASEFKTPARQSFESPQDCRSAPSHPKMTRQSPNVREENADSPFRRSLSRSTSKLPGPAGSLPKLKPNANINELDRPLKMKKNPARPSQAVEPSAAPSSQAEDEAWAAARSDLGPALWAHLSSYSVAKVTARANRRELWPRGKVPVMCVQVADMAVESVDARVLLRDATGTMKGTLHQEALRSFRGHLRTGTVMVLKLVSVFSPSPKTHYLNITRPNLVQLYDPGASHQGRLTRLTADLVRRWESECSRLPAAPPSRPLRPSAPLFRGPAVRPTAPAPPRPPPLRPAAPRGPAVMSPAVSVARGFECLLDDDMDDLLASSMCDGVDFS